MKRKIKWNVLIDSLILVVFSILTISLLGMMVIRGLSTIELVLLFICPMIASGSLENVIEL